MSANSRRTFRQVFEDENTYGSTMLVALVDQLGGVDWFEWDPDSLRYEIQDRFDAKISLENMDKIQALLTALTTNLFYVSLETFIGVCNALDGDGSDFNTFDPADVQEMAWAITEVAMNDPLEEGPGEAFSQEIKHYIGVQAKLEGFTELPKPLTFGVMPDDRVDPSEVITDAVMYSAYWRGEKDKIKKVQRRTQERYNEMIRQIHALPLQDRDAESWQKFSGRVSV